MTQLANEERERSREITREAMEASRLESQAYIQEQRQVQILLRLNLDLHKLKLNNQTLNDIGNIKLS